MIPISQAFLSLRSCQGRPEKIFPGIVSGTKISGLKYSSPNERIEAGKICPEVNLIWGGLTDMALGLISNINLVSDQAVFGGQVSIVINDQVSD